MANTAEIDLRETVLSNSSFGPTEICQLSEAISADFSCFGSLRDAVAELEVREDRSPATAVRLGVCYYLLGRFDRALETLSNSDGGALAHFFMGKTYFAQDNHRQAIACYEAAQGAGYDADSCVLGKAEALRYAGESEAALALLDGLFGPVEQTAEYLYQRAATVAALRSNLDEQIALYERALEADPNHPGVLFGLALENDRCGNDELALNYYRRAADGFPSHVGVLLNLGILYEDNQNFEGAQQCYNRILEVQPNHPNALMFLKDAEASDDQFFDLEAEKASDRLAQVLNIPVTDFELSVRSRNCLQKMGVMTLGDLARTSEQTLLSSKNFGETSLVEITEMLNSKGLELGQFAEEGMDAEPEIDVSHLPPDQQTILDRPISDLNLSVRARKCMVRLRMNTIGELIRKTGDDLLESKNFGVTSLNEVREKLTLFDLNLRGD